MRTISLTQGYEAIVDDEDYDFIMQWKWHAFRGHSGIVYAARNSAPVDGRRYHIFMHQVLNGTATGLDTDHVNGNGVDNRKDNLRSASRSQNMWNRKPNSRGSSIHKGVYWHAQHRKWASSIQVCNKRFHIGLFANEADAARAYVERAAKEFGCFNRKASND